MFTPNVGAPLVTANAEKALSEMPNPGALPTRWRLLWKAGFSTGQVRRVGPVLFGFVAATVPATVSV